MPYTASRLTLPQLSRGYHQRTFGGRLRRRRAMFGRLCLIGRERVGKRGDLTPPLNAKPAKTYTSAATTTAALCFFASLGCSSR